MKAKPASAPPAALQRVSEIEDAIAAGTMSAAQVFTQMRQLVAASAQVREVEPFDAMRNCRGVLDYDASGDLVCPKCGFKPGANNPAPEPVPVAQDVSDALDIVEMASSAVRGPYTSPELQEPLEQAHATLTKHIADHARIVAELEAQYHEAMAEAGRWAAQAATNRLRAEAFAASLAARRADAERYLWLRNKPMPGSAYIAAYVAGAGEWCQVRGEAADAAIDKLRQEAPHAE